MARPPIPAFVHVFWTKPPTMYFRMVWETSPFAPWRGP
jgi:hypothetical protein